jgi:hypothetical protein
MSCEDMDHPVQQTKYFQAVFFLVIPQLFDTAVLSFQLVLHQLMPK